MPTKSATVPATKEYNITLSVFLTVTAALEAENMALNNTVIDGADNVILDDVVLGHRSTREIKSKRRK